MKRINFIICLICLVVSCKSRKEQNKVFVLNSEQQGRTINEQLYDAVTIHDTQTVKKLLSSKIDVNYTFSDKIQSILLIALLNEDRDIAKLLIDAGAKIDYTNSYNYDLFQICMNNEKYECISLLLQNDDFLDFLASKNNFWQVAIFFWNKNPAKLEEYLETILSLRAIPYPEENLIKIAIDENSLSALRWLYSNGYPFSVTIWNEFTETYDTPENYALTVMDNMMRYSGKDYSQSDLEELSRMKEIIQFLRQK